MAFVMVTNYYGVEESGIRIDDSDDDIRGFRIDGVDYLVEAIQHDAISAEVDICFDVIYRILRITDKVEGVAQAIPIKNKKTLEFLTKRILEDNYYSEQRQDIMAVKEARKYRGDAPYGEPFDLDD